MAGVQPTAKSHKFSTVSFDNGNRTNKDVKKNTMVVMNADNRRTTSTSAPSSASKWLYVNKPVASIGALRNRMLITLEKALQLLDEFEKKYLLYVDDDFHGVYQDFVRPFLTRIGYKSDLLDCEHLERVIIRKFKKDPMVADRADFQALTAACLLNKSFKDMRSGVQARLEEVLDFAEMFCLSFSQHADSYSFDSVESYENRQTECLREIRLNVDAADASFQEITDIRPLSTYLDGYSKVIHYTELVVNCQRVAVLALKRWVIADEQYERALDKELNYLKHFSHLSDSHANVAAMRFDVKTKLPHSAGLLRRVEQNSAKANSVMGRLREKLFALTRKLQGVQLRMRDLRQELIELKRKAQRRQSAESFASIGSEIATIKHKLRQYHIEEDCLNNEICDTRESIISMQKEVHMLQNDITKRRRSADVTRKRTGEHNILLKTHLRNSEEINTKISILQRLISLKKNPDTLRKIELNMINIDYKEAMMHAISKVAGKVGSQWPAVYSKLPFVPARSDEHIMNDIKTIKKCGVTCDRSEDEMANTAFQLWAKRSTAATINELTFATRKLLESANRKEEFKKQRHRLHRPKKRFYQLAIKPNVIYM